MDQAFAEGGVVPLVEMEIASNETIKQAVAAGLGIGFLSAHAVRNEVDRGTLQVVDVQGFPVMRQWYVVSRSNRRPPRIAQAFEQFLLDNGARLIGTPPTGPSPRKGRP
jgi:DNA-binding transcriptional LysR family regulator